LAPTVGIAATGFCYLGGILQLFHRQDQQILRLPTAAATRSHLVIPSTSANFVFNIVDCGLLRSRARRRALAQTIGNARGLDINSPRSAENNPQDLRFRRHQQRDDPNNARGLDNNFAFDRDYDSTITTRLRHRRLHHADHAASDKS
jgi:hypothetical protein